MTARPHPGAALRADSVETEDAADNDAVFQHVVVVISPLARWARYRSACENERSHRRWRGCFRCFRNGQGTVGASPAQVKHKSLPSRLR
jgi:hypothetical protein